MAAWGPRGTPGLFSTARVCPRSATGGLHRPPIPTESSGGLNELTQSRTTWDRLSCFSWDQQVRGPHADAAVMALLVRSGGGNFPSLTSAAEPRDGPELSGFKRRTASAQGHWGLSPSFSGLTWSAPTCWVPREARGDQRLRGQLGGGPVTADMGAPLCRAPGFPRGDKPACYCDRFCFVSCAPFVTSHSSGLAQWHSFPAQEGDLSVVTRRRLSIHTPGRAPRCGPHEQGGGASHSPIQARFPSSGAQSRSHMSQGIRVHTSHVTVVMTGWVMI